MFRKAFSGFLAAALFLGMSPLAQAAFFDVSINHFNYDAIFYVEGQGIVSGYPDGSFKPDQTINRAEFTKIIVGALTDTDDLERGLKCFSDIKSEEWYTPYVCKAKVEGWVSGYPDKTFRPTQMISFAEAAKIISEAFDLQTRSDAVWYKPYVDALALQNAIPVTIKSFTKNVTRGEMAEMIYRVRANVRDKESTNYQEILDPSDRSELTTPTLPQERSIRITARNYLFNPTEIEVNRGDTLNIEIQSADNRYDFTLDGYGVVKTVEGGETIQFQLEVLQAGNFTFSCKLYCVGHPETKGTLTVR